MKSNEIKWNESKWNDTSDNLLYCIWRQNHFNRETKLIVINFKLENLGYLSSPWSSKGIKDTTVNQTFYYKWMRMRIKKDKDTDEDEIRMRMKMRRRMKMRMKRMRMRMRMRMMILMRMRMRIRMRIRMKKMKNEYNYMKLAERARRCHVKKKYILKNLKIKKKVEKKSNLFSLCQPQATMNATKKCQTIQSSRLGGYREHIYECLVLLYRWR